MFAFNDITGGGNNVNLSPIYQSLNNITYNTSILRTEFDNFTLTYTPVASSLTQQILLNSSSITALTSGTVAINSEVYNLKYSYSSLSSSITNLRSLTGDYTASAWVSFSQLSSDVESLKTQTGGGDIPTSLTQQILKNSSSITSITRNTWYLTMNYTNITGSVIPSIYSFINSDINLATYLACNGETNFWKYPNGVDDISYTSANGQNDEPNADFIILSNFNASTSYHNYTNPKVIFYKNTSENDASLIFNDNTCNCQYFYDFHLSSVTGTRNAQIGFVSNTNINYYNFMNTGTLNLNLTSGYIFSGATNLKSCFINARVDALPSALFKYCSNLVKLHIGTLNETNWGTNITSIYASVFHSCKKLKTSFDFRNLDSLSQSAFALVTGCKISLPSRWTSFSAQYLNYWGLDTYNNTVSWV